MYVCNLIPAYKSYHVTVILQVVFASAVNAFITSDGVTLTYEKFMYIMLVISPPLCKNQVLFLAISSDSYSDRA